VVTGVAPLESAGPDQISFLTDARYHDAARTVPGRRVPRRLRRHRLAGDRPCGARRPSRRSSPSSGSSTRPSRLHPALIGPPWWPRKPVWIRPRLSGP
jgi:hypothetical protein